jgi:cobalt-zinc-cadmium efflux system protein
MIYFAIFGVIINFIASVVTKEGDSLNQKSVNLHMLEDVFGWIVVLIGSILMKFTNISYIDSVLSIFVAIFIIKHQNTLKASIKLLIIYSFI